MKKIAFLLLFVIAFASPFNVCANDVVASGSIAENITYFSDGSYMITYLDLDEELDDSNHSRATGNYEVGGNKAAEYYDTSGNLDWKVNVKGVFLIVPSNSLQSGDCIECELTYRIHDSAWKISNIVERMITNNAHGSCTMKNKFLGITLQTVNVDLYVTCDPQGNLS